MSPQSITRTESDVLDSVEQVMDDTVRDGHSRRSLMTKAGGLLAAGAALTLPGAAPAGAASRSSILDLLATYETFGVTLLSEAVRRAPGTPSARFSPVLMAANTTEFHHLTALRAIGGRPKTAKFWIPDAVFDGGTGFFRAVAAQEEVEISAYLIGVTNATQRRNTKEARLYAEALGTEAEHRVAARNALSILTGQAIVPNNRGFEAFKQKSVASAVRATEALGVGIGKRGTKPGRFYTYRGDPRKNGTGSTVLTPDPR